MMSDKPTARASFRQLGIPIYLVWDGDRNANDENEEERKNWNHWLQRLVGIADPVDWPAEVTDKFACFEDRLEKTLEQELGEPLFGELRTKYKRELGLGDAQAVMKNPVAVGSIVGEAAERGSVSETLRWIVCKAIALGEMAYTSGHYD